MNMKNFKNYTPEKYAASDYQKVEDGIYRTKNPYGFGAESIFVTSLTFEQEPECYGEEDGGPRNVTQIPLEDLLDKFSVYVTDFYDQLNSESEIVCYQEFGSDKLENIQKLRDIIGKHVYAEPFEENGEEYSRLVIE